MPISEETRAKLRAAKLANPVRYWLGRQRGPQSAEWRANISRANKGRPKPEGFGAHLRALRAGVPRSEEVKAKMRAGWARPEVRAKMRRPNPNKRRSPEHYERLAQMARGKPAQYPMRRFYYAGEAFRSSWEVRVAKAFDAIGMRWEYESKRFVLGSKTYAPDFYLPDEGMYVEVKGYYGPKSQTTANMFYEQYPDIPLAILLDKQIRALENLAASRCD